MLALVVVHDALFRDAEMSTRVFVCIKIINKLLATMLIARRP